MGGGGECVVAMGRGSGGGYPSVLGIKSRPPWSCAESGISSDEAKRSIPMIGGLGSVYGIKSVDHPGVLVARVSDPSRGPLYPPSVPKTKFQSVRVVAVEAVSSQSTVCAVLRRESSSKLSLNQPFCPR